MSHSGALNLGCILDSSTEPMSGLHTESIETVRIRVGQISQLCQRSLSDSDAY